jgi:hypothetical protein
MCYKVKLDIGYGKRQRVAHGDSESDYQGGPGQAAAPHPFQEGQSGNPGGRSAKSLPALLADALNEPTFVTIGDVTLAIPTPTIPTPTGGMLPRRRALRKRAPQSAETISCV